jgi:hypothetical protein
VYFFDNNVLFGQGTVSNGVATYATDTLPVGNHPITGLFIGTGGFQNSTFATLNHFVGNPTTVGLARTAGNSPSTVGQSVTFTATINESAAAVPTGTVTFYVDGAPVSPSSPVSGNSATFTTTSLTAGNRSITAVYNGDGNFLASPNSNVVSQTVAPVAVAFDIQGTANPQNNLPGASDSIIYTYSTLMTPGSILAGWTGSTQVVTVTLNRPTVASATTMSVCTNVGCAPINLGSVSFGDTSGTRFIVEGTTATATANMTLFEISGRTFITLTFTSTFSGTTLAPSSGGKTLVWTPSTAATDTNGASMSGASVNEVGANDADF